MITQTNLSMSLGDTANFTDAILDAAGAAVDVTGWAFAFVLHAAGDPGTVYLTLTSGSGRVTVPTPTVAPQIAWSVLSTDVPLLPAGAYGWYMQRTDSPNPVGLSGGQFTIDPL